MDTNDAVIESQTGQEAESSSDDLRSAIDAARKEVAERQRDEQGRFAKADQEQQQEQVSSANPAEKQTPEKKVNQQQQQQEQPQTGATQQVEQIKAPDAWSPAAKAKFAELPADIQAEINRREAEVHKGFTAQDDQRKAGKAFNDLVTPYLPMIRAEGGDPLSAVQSLLQTAYTLRAAGPEQKEQMFIQLANQFGVNMQGIFNRLSQGAQQTPPQVAQLQQQLQQLQQQISQGSQNAEAQAEAQLKAEIERFASDPKNTYFSNVRSEMAALMSAGRAKDLQEAYDMACWARPDIRPLLMQQSVQQTEQQKQAEARAKAEKARAAGVSVTGAPAGSAMPGTVDPNASLRDQLRAALREHSGRL
ncbi:hypothetical protein [Paludibacterium sp.]|uniref:hypothetical protein n=1 Tax=Paludibacterium sp. TaxID=1917523 RepID=UPI0025ED2DD2|nr:hypothetical protein [Paludibacterium sp.]MBV8649690.1 hypothetical protein [Paludibacterium sp.]